MRRQFTAFLFILFCLPCFVQADNDFVIRQMMFMQELADTGLITQMEADNNIDTLLTEYAAPFSCVPFIQCDEYEFEFPDSFEQDLLFPYMFQECTNGYVPPSSVWAACRDSYLDCIETAVCAWRAKKCVEDGSGSAALDEYNDRVYSCQLQFAICACVEDDE